MTSTKLRKRKLSFKSEFPCTKIVRRLRAVHNFNQLCVASIDKVSFKIKERLEFFDKPLYFENEKAGSIYHYNREFLFERRLQVIHFQIFVRKKSTDRTLLINPRHFLDFNRPIPAFEKFLSKLFEVTSAKITRIDLSFQIPRYLISCDFIKWSMFLEDAHFNTVKSEAYTNTIHANFADATLESYRVGKRPFSAQVYDCDAKSSKGKVQQGPSSLVMQDAYNLEFRLGRDHKIVKNMKCITDIYNIDIEEALAKVHFVDPSKCKQLANTNYEHLLQSWNKHGIQFARHKAYPVSRNYKPFKKLLPQLRVKDSTFKAALIELAKSDLSKFHIMKLNTDRKRKKALVYSIPPLFTLS